MLPAPAPYLLVEPTRSELERTAGLLVLEFGADWCGFCRVAQMTIVTALRRRPGVRHVKVADAPGKPLGRSYGVKLWPTLIVLQDGREVARGDRPTSRELLAIFQKIDRLATAGD